MLIKYFAGFFFFHLRSVRKQIFKKKTKICTGTCMIFLTYCEELSFINKMIKFSEKMYC